MKLMIDISDSTYEAIMARDWKNAGWLFNKDLKAIHDGTPIPDNATNGDMIKALFPEAEIIINKKNMISWMYKGMIKTYPLDWWNAPYKRGKTE